MLTSSDYTQWQMRQPPRNYNLNPNFMRNLLLVACLVFVMQPLAAEQPQTPAVTWIDVRSWVEHQVDHIDGDPRISQNDIVDGVNELVSDKNTPIRLYCARGGRAQTAKDRLLAAGYTNVENVGGIADARRLRGLSEADDSP